MFSNHIYPSLDQIINSLYRHFSLCGKNKDFSKDYWQVLPDEAYEILDVLRPFYDIEEGNVPAHKHFLYEPVMHGDLRMLEYLWQMDTLKYRSWKQPLDKLLYLGVLDFCYMRLPSWQGLPQDEGDSKDIPSEAFCLDLHSPELLKILYAQAERCRIPVPAHLNFLMTHNCSMPSSASPLVLYSRYPQLQLHISYVIDDGIRSRCWKILDPRIDHKHQCAEELVKSCIASGEYWSMTCECGIPACANVNRPVLAMRFDDNVRWRITASDDDADPDVYYLSVPVKPYLSDMDVMLKTIESTIRSDGPTEEVPYVYFMEDCILTTDIGLKKTQQIRSMIRKELRRDQKIPK